MLHPGTIDTYMPILDTIEGPLTSGLAAMVDGQLRHTRRTRPLPLTARDIHNYANGCVSVMVRRLLMASTDANHDSLIQNTAWEAVAFIRAAKWAMHAGAAS